MLLVEHVLRRIPWACARKASPTPPTPPSARLEIILKRGRSSYISGGAFSRRSSRFKLNHKSHSDGFRWSAFLQTEFFIIILRFGSGGDGCGGGGGGGGGYGGGGDFNISPNSKIPPE